VHLTVVELLRIMSARGQKKRMFTSTRQERRSPGAPVSTLSGPYFPYSFFLLLSVAAGRVGILGVVYPTEGRWDDCWVADLSGARGVGRGP